MLSQLSFVRHHGVEYRRHRPALPAPRLEDIRVTREMRERYHRRQRRRLRGSRWLFTQMQRRDASATMPQQSGCGVPAAEILNSELLTLH